jgi:hypothetical protein
MAFSGMDVRKRSRRIVRLAAAVSLAAAAAAATASAPAAAAPRVVDLAGLRGARVEIAGSVRLADAGAIVAATVVRRGEAHAVLVRLRHDGTVVEDFGRGGAASAGRGAAAAVASDAGGRRIVVALRRGGRLRLAGLDGRGRRRTSFGRRGSVALPAGGDPVALAARGTRLLAATGSALAALDARTGRTLARATAAAGFGGPAACAGARATSVVLDAAGRAIVAWEAAGAAGCAAALTVHDARTLAAPASAVAVDGTRALVAVLPGERDACVAARRADGSVRARRVDPARIADGDPLAGAPALAAPVTERLVALAPTPGDGCNVLLAGTGAAGGGRVVQAGADGVQMRVTALPARFRAGAATVCRRHLLVAGARGRGGHPTGSLAVVGLHAHG